MLQISCKDLCIGYDNKPIINNLNFEIETGDYFVVVGKNGSGKSTLIKTLLGLLNPISGSIIFQEKIKKEGIGYLPQQSNTQKDFPVSIWEVVVSGFLLHTGLRPFYNKEEKEVALNNINIMGLKGMENY